MCKDENFYFHVLKGNLQLDKNHPYYHQLQLQLYVTSDRAKWCDFCVFTSKGVCVQRIYPDEFWEEQICSQLDDYFFNHILPELLCQRWLLLLDTLSWIVGACALSPTLLVAIEEAL